ncbi:uncharacterized protein LOC127278635 [Leptopilina boulardi]|uniref:uncharacterized protein LOC127278635 n=1 Tax=Leptopilina boulardi TaxID=63433 RepID=UPI0021F63AFA|nr:uncharacterized protein LOC127278635 [Leptopilina boulardi]
MEASTVCPQSRRLFVTDQSTKTQFLIDTGADLCVFPRTMVPGRREKTNYELYAANGTLIATYGFETINLNIGLRRNFSWRFVIAEVSKPIIGVDFLGHYSLLVDIQNQRLIDNNTTVSVVGHVVDCSSQWLDIRSIAGSSQWHKLLEKYLDVTRPSGIEGNVKHTTKHHIHTTPGPPIVERPRRLAPDKLKLAKEDFSQMITLKILRPSKGRWASPLHLVPKKNG